MLAHHGHSGAGRAKASENVQLEGLVELDVGRIQPGAAAAAGVVHENIEPAEVRRGRLNEVFNVAGFADIGRLGEDVVAEALSGGIEPRLPRSDVRCLIARANGRTCS